MGLRDTIKKAVDTAFLAMGDIPESVQYGSVVADPTYDPTTGVITSSDGLYAVSVVFIEFTDSEKANTNSGIRNTDRKALMPMAVLKDLLIEPKVNDYLVRGSGPNEVNWNLVSFSLDPTESLIEMQVREEVSGG